MIEILDNESKAKRVAFVFSLKSGGESFTCLMKCLSRAWEFHQNPIFQNFECIFRSFFLLSFFQPPMFEFISVFLRIDESMVLNFA